MNDLDFPITLQVDNSNDVHGWLMRWLARQPYTLDECRSLDALRVGRYHGGVFAPADGQDGRNLPRYVLIPGYGAHAFRHGDTEVRVERKVLAHTTDGRLPHDRRDLLRDILREARAVANEEEPGSLNVYATRHGDWYRASVQPVRPPGSIVLPEGFGERVLKDVGWFLGNESWYVERGLPYRRGYLFRGRPGCGKTPFATALAGRFGLGLYFLSLTTVRDDDTLRHLVDGLPSRSLLLVEDVDSVFADRRDEKAESRTDVSFSGLLNALDGAVAGTGRVLVMTANHEAVLDKALTRPGRVDVRLEFPDATADVATRLYQRFFPDAPWVVAREFGERNAGDTPAEPQERLIEMTIRDADL
jgi:chaperone BCS1